MLGHAWTIGGHLAGALRPTLSEAGQPWRTRIDDPVLGAVEITGRWHRRRGRAAVVVVHGLGGCIDSPYIHRMTAAALAAGHGVLRLNLRGADRSGADIYHAGLTEDLVAALESPELAGYDRVWVAGFSLGGHVTLRLAAAGHPRLAAAVAVCAPLDLAKSSAFIDRRRRALYRHHVLRGLKEIYRAFANKRPSFAIDESEIRSIRTLREWDARTVVPRFGFADVDDYYRRVSAGPALALVKTPTLFVHTTSDPMVRVDFDSLRNRSSAVEMQILAGGGHVAFPSRLALEDTVLSWLARG